MTFFCTEENFCTYVLPKSIKCYMFMNTLFHLIVWSLYIKSMRGNIFWCKCCGKTKWERKQWNIVGCWQYYDNVQTSNRVVIFLFEEIALTSTWLWLLLKNQRFTFPLMYGSETDLYGSHDPIVVTWPRECLGLRQCLVNRYIYSLNYFVRKSILYMYLMMIKSHNLFSVLSCVFWTYDDSVDSTSSWRNKWMKINVNSLVFVSKCLFLKIVKCDAS